MLLIVLASNYLVQFQFNFLKLENILTWGAFTYPIAFLVTDLANRVYGLNFAKRIIIIGFFWGVVVSSFFSLKVIDLISLRIVIGSGLAFLSAQMIDAIIFDKLRNQRRWYVPPIISSSIASFFDTIIFFSIAFYNTGVPWVTLSIGDFCVKMIMALSLLIPFRLILLNFFLINRSSSN